jgi:hypothetical protein
MTALLVTNTIINLFLAVIWSKEGWWNLIFKFTFFLLTIINGLAALAYAGYIVHRG